jgi:hypothetical protein
VPRFGRGNLTILACSATGSASKGYSGVVLARACDRVEREMVALRRTATPPLPARSWAMRAQPEAQTCR